MHQVKRAARAQLIESISKKTKVKKERENSTKEERKTQRENLRSCRWSYLPVGSVEGGSRRGARECLRDSPAQLKMIRLIKMKIVLCALFWLGFLGEQYERKVGAN